MVSDEAPLPSAVAVVVAVKVAMVVVSFGFAVVVGSDTPEISPDCDTADDDAISLDSLIGLVIEEDPVGSRFVGEVTRPPESGDEAVKVSLFAITVVVVVAVVVVGV